MRRSALPPHLDELTGRIVDSAYRLYHDLGPGGLESLYQECFSHRLRQDGMSVEENVPLDIEYDGLRIARAYVADMIVDGTAVVELKSTDRFAPVHVSQLATYLKLSGHPVGLLINFGMTPFGAAVKRVLPPSVKT